MRKPHEIVSDLKALLTPVFPTVLVSPVQVNDQFLAEVRAISTAGLPAVIIVYESFLLTEKNTLEETEVSLVLVADFVAGSEEKALSALTSLSSLRELFPATGRRVSGVFYMPTGCQPASVDKLYTCFALDLTAKQGSM